MAPNGHTPPGRDLYYGGSIPPPEGTSPGTREAGLPGAAASSSFSRFFSAARRLRYRTGAGSRVPLAAGAVAATDSPDSCVVSAVAGICPGPGAGRYKSAGYS